MSREVVRRQKVGRVAQYVGLAFISAAAVYFIVTGGTTGAVAGGGMIAGGGAVYLGNRNPRRDSGSLRVRGDAVDLPRRVLYGYLTGLGATAVGVGLFALSLIAADRGDSAVGAAFLLLVSPVLVVVGILMVGGTLLGRGVVRLTASELTYRRVVGTTRRAGWDAIVSTATDRTAVVVTAPGVRMIIPNPSQGLTDDTLIELIDRFRTASPGERHGMIGSGAVVPHLPTAPRT